MTTTLMKEVVKAARDTIAHSLGLDPDSHHAGLDLFDLGVEIGINLGVELAKPIVDPVLRQTHVGTAWTYSGARGGMTFKTKELAIADALAHGYREGKQ